MLTPANPDTWDAVLGAITAPEGEVRLVLNPHLTRLLRDPVISINGDLSRMERIDQGLGISLGRHVAVSDAAHLLVGGSE